MTYTVSWSVDADLKGIDDAREAVDYALERIADAPILVEDGRGNRFEIDFHSGSSVRRLDTQDPLVKWELFENLRAADVRSSDVVELPDRLWVWDDEHADEGMARWRGVLARNDSRLNWRRWYFVYDALDSTDVGTSYAGDVGAECALEELEEHFIVLRIGAEAPRDRDAPEDRLIALHEFDLVRVQRPTAEPKAESDQDDASLLQRAVPMLVRLGDFIGNGELDPDREGSVGARCDLLLDIQRRLRR